MTVEERKPVTPATDKKESRGLHKSDLVVPLFVLSGFGASYVTFMTIVASMYDPQGHALARLVTCYGAPLLFLPCFLLALLRRRWMSVPFWICSFTMLAIAVVYSHNPSAAVPFRPNIGMLFIPALAQLARLFRGKQS